MKKLKNYYVLSYNFNGANKGFAIGFDSEYIAFFVAKRLMCGLADVVSDWQLEDRYPSYFHNLISKTI